MRSTGSKVGHLRNEKTSSRNTIMVNYFRNSEIETILDPFETNRILLKFDPLEIEVSMISKKRWSFAMDINVIR